MNHRTYDFRIGSGVLHITIRKKLPWYLFFLPRKFYYFKFQIIVTTASGMIFEYPSFVMLLNKQQAEEALLMVREITNSNAGATKYMEHENPNVKHLAYLKQSDFRDIPIRMEIDSDQDKNKTRKQEVNEFTHAPSFIIPIVENKKKK